MFRLRHFRAAEASFLAGLGLLLLSGIAPGQATPRKPLPTEPHEKSDDPPAPLPMWGTGVSPGMISQQGPFTSRQVNVNLSGQNITGDAANEPSIAVDPTDHNRMVIGWRQFNSVTSNFRQGGWGYTTNAGTTWTFPGVLENNVFRSDPVLTCDDTGRFLYLSLLETYDVTLWDSLNGGQTFTNIGPAKGGDKQWFVVDNTNSIGHGFLYQFWDYASPFAPKEFSRSTDGGISWMDPIDVPNAPQWGTPDVDSNGILFFGGVTQSLTQFWCVRSTDAKNGAVTPTFDQVTEVSMGGVISYFDTVNPEGLIGQVFLAVDRSGTSSNNNVYMLASVQPTGFSTGSDVMFVRSTDSGLTFSAPKRVNDDPINHSKWHWFGTFAVAPNGRIDSVWLDTRNAANNTDSQLFYSYSIDAGNTWSPNVAVSVPFNPFLGYPNQNKLGDYMTIVSDNTGGDVAYAATFNSEQDVYYVRVAPGVGPTPPCTNDTWTPTSINSAPSARAGHTAVWTGSEMIVWGGQGNLGVYANSGGKYDPGADSWTPTSITGAPSARAWHTAVWTGSEMIVWGGLGGIAANTGGRYNPATDSWTATSMTNAPAVRSGHTAVWTGSEMIVWGGADGGNYLNTGGRYNPTTDSWTPMSTTGAPTGRDSHSTVWTGSQMIVWGGTNNTTFITNTGGRYNPSTDSWTATSTINVPTARVRHTAVWTGSEMTIWGGNPSAGGFENTGGNYNPSTDSWTPTSTTNAPAGRLSHSAVWSGSEMIVWGGGSSAGTFNTGGRYHRAADSWMPTATAGAPMDRSGQTAVWTGAEMIVWGGSRSDVPRPSVGVIPPALPNYFDSGGKYCAQQPSPVPSPTPSTPTPTPTLTPTPTPTPSTPTPTPTPTATPTASPTPISAAQALNLSTRLRVQTGDNVGIGGFIITGSITKHVLIRAIGPSLAGSGVPNVLADPVLELNGPGSFVTITNDNWRDDPAQEALIKATGIPPANDLESAIEARLAPGAYTAIVSGNGGSSGVGLVEVYDLNADANSKLANISTRALVGTGDSIVIAGFMLGGDGDAARVVARGIGPSLSTTGVPNAVANPTLEMRDGNGTLMMTNNDWQDDPVQAAELIAAGLAPSNSLESGIATTLPPGAYTALLSGVNNGSGIGLIEIYDRGP